MNELDFARKRISGQASAIPLYATLEIFVWHRPEYSLYFYYFLSMGQTRPVTIYRLVTENTIEEKIIALHAEKRDLADSLLGGGDVAGKLDTAALLRLLKESAV